MHVVTVILCISQQFTTISLQFTTISHLHITCRFEYCLVQNRALSYHLNLNTSDYRDSSYDMIRGKLFHSYVHKRQWTPIHSSEWMCMAQWYNGLLIWRLLCKGLPRTIWHSNCLYSLRNLNVSSNLWLSKSLYRALLYTYWLVMRELVYVYYPKGLWVTRRGTYFPRPKSWMWNKKRSLGKERNFFSCSSQFTSREGAVTRHYFQRLVPSGHYSRKTWVHDLDYITL